MKAYDLARETYAAHGVNTESVFLRLAANPLTLPCWQGDDVGGFENPAGGLTGGLQATGNYPGKARTINELRADLSQAFSLIPGKHRLNLHACYADFGGGKKVERNELTVAQFQSWINWCQERGLGLDFNPTYFSHPLANTGFTLSHKEAAVRKYWVEHGIACRRIGAEIGKQLGNTCVTNVWIPDGSTPRTAKAHVSAILVKLEAADRTEAVSHAFERGLLKP